MTDERSREVSDAYCPECKSYIVNERVTFEECCDACGTSVEWHGHFERPASEKSKLKADPFFKRIQTIEQAVGQMIHLQTCEQEGISCAMPSPQEWLQGYDKLAEAHDELKLILSAIGRAINQKPHPATRIGIATCKAGALWDSPMPYSMMMKACPSCKALGYHIDALGTSSRCKECNGSGLVSCKEEGVEQ